MGLSRHYPPPALQLGIDDERPARRIGDNGAVLQAQCIALETFRSPLGLHALIPDTVSATTMDTSMPSLSCCCLRALAKGSDHRFQEHSIYPLAGRHCLHNSVFAQFCATDTAFYGTAETPTQSCSHCVSTLQLFS